MKINNQLKSKKNIFLIWGLFTLASILVVLVILLLAIKPESTTIINKPTPQEQDKTYNRLMNKLEKEIDKLTQKQEQTSSLKYPPKTIYHDDGKKIQYIEEYDQ